MVRRQTSYIMAQVLAEDPAYANRSILIPGSCNEQPNTQCWHDDIADIGVVASAGECCAACERRDGCRFWTFNEGVDQHCWLKTACSEKKTKAGHISGGPGKSIGTVQEHYLAWEKFFYAQLKERATRGVFVELASNNYWYRTWPCMFNLLDLPSSQRVRQRAKMFVDIAMVEAEQVAINGVRGGQKSRSKKDDLPHYNGLFGTMYSSLAPMFYGDNLTTTSMGRARIIDAEATSYKMSNVSVLMHQLGKPAVYTVRNRMLGQFAPRGSKVQLALVSDQVHHVEVTPSYSIGGVEFSPTNKFIPNSQLRWTGIFFCCFDVVYVRNVYNIH